MAKKTISIADKLTLDTVKNIVEDIQPKINTIKTNVADLVSKVGTTSNTGGSATAGTIFAKLNKLITDVTTLTTSLTSTRAGYIDKINTNTATSTTSSSTGTLSQKLNYLINQRQASLTGTGTTVYSSSSTIFNYTDEFKCLAKFIAPIDGLYRVTIKGATGKDSGGVIIYKIEDAKLAWGYNNFNYNTEYAYAHAISQSASYEASTIGSYSYMSSSFAWDTSIGSDDAGGGFISAMPRVGFVPVDASTATTTSFNIYCKAGEPVQLVGNGSATTRSKRLPINSIVITYQNK